MNKLVHYILIAIMFNWNIAVFAEEENKGCKWEVVEETDTYIQESCVGGAVSYTHLTLPTNREV